jgi:two-component system phosphate regulon sensor histidine kinase PhoR
MVLPRPKILVVDDEANVLLTVAAILEQEGYDVDSARGGDPALQAIRAAHYDLVLTDLKMPGIDGLRVLEEVRKISPSTVTVMMTGYGSVDSALEAVQRGAYEYLLKPTEVADLKAAVRRSLERKRLSEIDTLYRIGRTLATALDPQTITAEVTDAVRQVLGVAHASLISLASSGPDLETPLRHVLRDATVLPRLERGEVIGSADMIAPLERWALTHGAQSYVLVPGIANGRLICVLCADNGAEPFEFHASVLRFLRSLAAQTALAVSNAALFAELQRNNQQLAEANTKLQELDKLKSQFLSVATHELRTPLSIILGYNSMLAESLNDRLSDDEKDTLRESVTACKRLIRLVNSMLDITQIESGKMRMNYASSDLRRIVGGVITLFQQEARTKQIRLGMEVPSRWPKVILDSERIEQVLVNLLGNALKFTPAGGSVVVAVRHLPEARSVQVSVRDTGIGIAPEARDKIFDEFAQVERGMKKRHREGSGLGLAIARRIVEAHQGSLQVESEPGRGSKFFFTIPVDARTGTVTSAVSA